MRKRQAVKIINLTFNRKPPHRLRGMWFVKANDETVFTDHHKKWPLLWRAMLFSRYLVEILFCFFKQKLRFISHRVVWELYFSSQFRAWISCRFPNRNGCWSWSKNQVFKLIGNHSRRGIRRWKRISFWVLTKHCSLRLAYIQILSDHQRADHLNSRREVHWVLWEAFEKFLGISSFEQKLCW